MRFNLFLLAFAAFAGAYYYHFHWISSADISLYRKECTRWISEEFAEGQPTRVLDFWKKKGRIVFEIAANRKDETGASVILCVVNPSNGQMLKPSVFDPSWR